MKRKLLRCMTAVATMLFATSCTSELALEGVPQSGVDGEEVEVTFSISAQSANAVMRADADAKGPGQWQNYIGRGKNIDMLVYAVYEANEEDYTLLEQYGQGYTGTGTKPDALGNTEHKGQTIIDVGDTFKNGGSHEITLRLMRNKTYHIAFWAQNSTSEAYDIDDLQNVQVNYANAKNNDELRDAFCKVEIFSVTPNASNRKVILTRPLAQINVGAVDKDKNLSITYRQSKIVINGVSRSINVVADMISNPDNIPVTFAWADLSQFTANDDGNLIVDLDNNKDTAPEKYTYLSMCYALVPATTSIPTAQNLPEYVSSVLNDVKIYLSDDITTPVSDDGETKIEISSVPVHRNWRTNILWTEPESTFNANPTITVNLDPDYDGEYNGKEGENHTWTVIGTTGN